MSARMLRVGPAISAVVVGVLFAVACGSGPTSQSTPEASHPSEVSPGPGAASPASGPEEIRYSNPVRYEVTYRVTAENRGFDVSRLLVYQPKPVEWAAQRDVRIVAANPSPAETRVDDSGNGMYLWELTGSPGPGRTLPFTVKFRLTAFETHADPMSARTQAYDKSSAIYRRYTASERFVESKDPRIRALAARIAGDERSPAVEARKFYDYVIDNSTYFLAGEGLKGAKWLLKTGEGECGDYASLFIALCRAAGIPARAVVGYWAESGLDQTHVWAEFYLEGYGWVPVDPTTAQLQDKREFYFGNMDNRRVILNTGFNIRLLPSAPDHYVAPFLQVPSWWVWGSGPEGSFVADRTAWQVRPLP